MHASIFLGGSQRLYRSFFEPGCWKHGKILRFLHRPEPMAGRLYLPVTCQALSRCVEEASDVGGWWWWWWWCWWWRGGGGGGGEFNPLIWFGCRISVTFSLLWMPGVTVDICQRTYLEVVVMASGRNEWLQTIRILQSEKAWGPRCALHQAVAGKYWLASEFRLDDLANFLYDGLGWCTRQFWLIYHHLIMILACIIIDQFISVIFLDKHRSLSWLRLSWLMVAPTPFVVVLELVTRQFWTSQTPSFGGNIPIWA